MRVSVIQMQAGSDPIANAYEAERLVRIAAARDQPDLITLPEMWSCLGGARADKQRAAERLPLICTSAATAGPLYAMLQRLAQENHVTLHGGSIGERVDGSERMFNTSLVFGPTGVELARYRKIHLFDVTTPDGAGYRESDSYGAGDAVVTFRVGPTTVGCAICYDLRFAELFLALRRAEASLILLPSAFTEATGRDHWEVLLRARAIETQCWFAAAAICGTHHDGRGALRRCWGRSLVADPWGTVRLMLDEAPGFGTVEVDAAATERIREQMPVLRHRRMPIAEQPVRVRP